MLPHEVPCTAEPGIDIGAARSSKAFLDWFGSVDRARFRIRSVHFQSVDYFRPDKIGFIKFKAEVADRDGKPLPGIVFVRGPSVAILPVLVSAGGVFTVITVQPRVATGRFDFEEIPAGMLDGSGNFIGVAAKELQEELGIEIRAKDLVDLGKLAGLSDGIFLSPGASDEAIRLFCFVQRLSPAQLAALSGRATGSLSEQEQITTKVLPIDELRRLPDAKSLLAYWLFQVARRSLGIES